MNILQKIIMRGNYNQPKQLYYNGDMSFEIDCCRVKENISFDTYFNLFSMKKWRKYCDTKDVFFSIEINGIGKIQLMSLNEEDEKGKLISEINYNSIKFEKKVILLEQSIIADSDFLYFKIIPIDITYFKNAFYYNEKNVRNIDLACCFCTYKREVEVKNNINLLSKYTNKMEHTNDDVDIYVADNASTLYLDDCKYDNVHVFSNKNYGGAAGFTRCIIESCLKNKKYDYIILMDDDACIEPYVVERTIYFLKNLKKEYYDSMIGGALLSKENMGLQLENGSYFTKEKSIKINQKYDMKCLKHVVKNEYEHDINYCGWFYSCIPTAFINSDNLPLPIFIHGDDQEYGMRFKKKIITLNGICIWHPNPGAVLRSYMSYYDSRNAAIIISEFYENFSRLSMIKLITGYTLPNILLYRYEAAYHTLNGFIDFYKGIDWLKEIDAEKLNLCILKSQKYHVEKIANFNCKFSQVCNDTSKVRRIKRFINYFIPAIYNERTYDIETDSRIINLISTKKINLINTKTNERYVFIKSYIKLFKIIKLYFKSILMVFRCHKKVWKEWNTRISEIQNIDFWNKYLDLEK